MRATCIFSALGRCFVCRWCVLVVGLGVPVAHGQSSVSVKVETTRGAMVPDVKVMAKKIEPQPRKKDKSKVADNAHAEVSEVPETETGKYVIERLKKGKYRFYACDDLLTYEPDFNDVDVGDNDAKKFTLVMQEQLTTQPVSGATAGSKVCLIHDETGCFAAKMVDRGGKITYRGVQDHYHVEDIQACKKD